MGMDEFIENQDGVNGDGQLQPSAEPPPPRHDQPVSAGDSTGDSAISSTTEGEPESVSLHEDGSESVSSEETASEAEAETETEAQSQPVTEAEAKRDTGADTDTDTDTGANSDADTDTSSDADTDAETAPQPLSPRDALSEMVSVLEAERAVQAAFDAQQLGHMYELLQTSLRNAHVFVSSKESPSKAEEWVRRSLTLELSAALRLSERKVAAMLNDAEALCERFPTTLETLSRGAISYQHAKTMISESIGLNDDERVSYEEQALEAAQQTTPPQFKKAAINIRERLNPETAVERKKKAVEERHVETWHAPDGMGWLALYGPIEVVESVHAAARNTAQSLKTAGDERTKAQIAADAVIDALMAGFTGCDSRVAADGTSSVPGDSTNGGPTSVGSDIRLGAIRPTVNVTVPVQTLMGLSDEPGKLDGYGPIDPETARRLAVQAPTFTRLLTDPESGAVLSVGRKRYTVPADLRRAVEIRDETCIGIGCNRTAMTCEMDHTLDWQYGGETSYDNLDSLCRSHHLVRHNTTWQIHMMQDGEFVWTSPLGRRYVIRPNDRPGFAPVAESPDSESPREEPSADAVEDDGEVPF